MSARRVAAIDCGTNSLRLLVADVDGQIKTDLARELRIVRLGSGVDVAGRLAPEAIGRAVAACREYATVIASLRVDTVLFCATSAVRDASNAEEFGDAVEAVLGTRPVVLTGEQEAAASFDGATRELSGSVPTAVVDLGGGSTEVVLGDAGSGAGVVRWSHSFDIGSVRMTERHLRSDPPSPAEIATCREDLDAVLAPVLGGLAPVPRLVGVAGTITTIAAHALRLQSYDGQRLHGARIGLDEIRSAGAELAAMTVAERRALPFMHPGRADVIGGGAIVMDRVLAQLPLATDELVVSEQDILDGIAWLAAGRDGMGRTMA